MGSTYTGSISCHHHSRHHQCILGTMRCSSGGAGRRGSGRGGGRRTRRRRRGEVWGGGDMGRWEEVSRWPWPGWLPLEEDGGPDHPWAHSNPQGCKHSAPLLTFHFHFHWVAVIVCRAQPKGDQISLRNSISCLLIMDPPLYILLDGPLKD